MSNKMLLIPVRGFPDYSVSYDGNIYKDHVKLKTHFNHGGYVLVRLRKDKKYFSKRVHLLVWTSFIGKVPVGYQVNHQTGLKWMNGLEDLNLMTQEQNLKHSRDTGLRKKPKIERKLNEEQILTLYTLKKSHKRKDLVTYTGTTIRNVEMILAGQTWKHLFKQVMNDRENTRGRMRFSKNHTRKSSLG